MKKLLTVIFAITLAAMSAVNAAASAAPTPNANGVAEISEDEAVVNAWTIIYGNVFGEDGEIIRDDYAGAWIEPGKEDYFYIALTSDADRAYYEKLLAGRTDYEFVTLKYSLKTLRHMRDEVMERCRDLFGGAGVYEQKNIIGFDLKVSKEEENGRIAAAMKAIKEEENLPDGIENAFEISYGVMIVDAVEDIPVPTAARIILAEEEGEFAPRK